MKNENTGFDFSVFGRVDLDALYAEWGREAPNERYDEPRLGWKLKFCYTFTKHICALLFEHEGESGITYYRVLVYEGEGESFQVVSKLRFREKCGFKVMAIGVDKKLNTLFVRRANKETKRDFYYSDLGETHSEYKGIKSIMAASAERSKKRFALRDGNTVLFFRVPENGRLYMPFMNDPKDLFYSDLWDDDDTGGDPDDMDDAGDDSDDMDDAGGEAEGAGENAQTDTKEPDPVPEKTALDELHEMIGLDDIKEKVDQILAFARVQKFAKEHGKEIPGINLNLSFEGNPGTAKTTVARIFARIMKENGILSKGELIEVGRSGLIAEYVGQTAVEVKELFKKAKGSVLFIDEAYSLVDSWENEYGDEAIATIVQEMENNRDDMVVIFAGYPEKMETFLSRNPGLRSRVPFVVRFRDYTEDELTAIAKMEAARRGYSLTDAAEKKVRALCNEAMKTKEFGNGRFSRNLVDAAVMKAASRMAFTLSDSSLDACFLLEECDFTAPGNLKTARPHVLGFKAA